MSKKRILFCVLSACVLLLFTFFFTLLWYNFFNKNLKKTVTPESSQIYISNNGPQVIKNIAVDDEGYVGEDSETYKFKVENTSSNEVAYKLLLKDISSSLTEDGCLDKDLLTREDLIYEISCNNEVIAKEEMTNIKSNIIDVKTIQPGEVNKYELKFYVKKNTQNFLNKHYHYVVDLAF